MFGFELQLVYFWGAIAAIFLLIVLLPWSNYWKYLIIPFMLILIYAGATHDQKQMIRPINGFPPEQEFVYNGIRLTENGNEVIVTLWLGTADGGQHIYSFSAAGKDELFKKLKELRIGTRIKFGKGAGNEDGDVGEDYTMQKLPELVNTLPPKK